MRNFKKASHYYRLALELRPDFEKAEIALRALES